MYKTHTIIKHMYNVRSPKSDEVNNIIDVKLLLRFLSKKLKNNFTFFSKINFKFLKSKNRTSKHRIEVKNFRKTRTVLYQNQTFY